LHLAPGFGCTSTQGIRTVRWQRTTATANAAKNGNDSGKHRVGVVSVRHNKRPTRIRWPPLARMMPQACAVSLSNIITFTAADRQAYLRGGWKNADARHFARIVKVAQRVIASGCNVKKIRERRTPQGRAEAKRSGGRR